MTPIIQTGYGQLPGELAQYVDDVCDRFDEAWRAGPQPNMEDYLAGAPGAARPVLLRELILIEMPHRRRAGRPARPEDYQSRFPEIDNDWLAAALAEPAAAPDTHLEASLDMAGYRLVAEAGRGQMGTLYQAFDTRLRRTVALKLLPRQARTDPRQLERFRREARAAGSLSHPAICALYEVGEHEGQPFLVMEWVEGQSLRPSDGVQPDLGRLLPAFRQVAGALRAAHAAGIVHRDIRPENLILRPDGYVKVLDFGLARLAPEDASLAPPHTDLSVLHGAARYLSPEQAKGEAVRTSSDIFSLGIILYELTTGRHPFETEGPPATRMAMVHRTPEAPRRINPEIPAHLESLILQMLGKDPGRRPTAAEVEAVLQELSGADAGARTPVSLLPGRRTVGRQEERKALWAGFESAAAGRGSILCVTGEPGIGKTTLVEEFLRDVAASGQVHCAARGRCSERLAGAEAYLPFLEALQNLLQDAAGTLAKRLLRNLAPTWHAQVAPSGDEESFRADLGHNRASSRERMKRELLGFLEELTRLRPLVLFLDDVHWADASTVDLLSFLGSRVQGLRLLLVVAYRPAELLAGMPARHPFVPVQLEWQRRGVCRELSLAFLSRSDVAGYLALTLSGHRLPQDFAHRLHALTEGNPLFLVELIRHFQQQQVIVETDGSWQLAVDLPDILDELALSVRGLIQRQLDRLDEADRRLLAVASVQGYEFDSAVVAGVLGLDAADVEERLEALDRVHGLVRLVREYEFPDRTLTLRYIFVHVLYQNTLYQSLRPSQRAEWSAGLAETILAYHGDRSAAHAAELACLFEAAQEPARAAEYFLQAAQNAARVFAHQEAVALAQRGLCLLHAMPETPERAERELPLQMILGMQLQITQGFAAPQAKSAYTRARELCRQVSQAPLFQVLWGLWLFHKVRSELPRAREMAQELFDLAQQLQEPGLVLQSHQALAVTTLCLGEPHSTRTHMEQALALYDPQRYEAHTFMFGQDPGAACQAFGGVAMWLLGYTEQALAISRSAVSLSHRLLQPSSQALALHFAAMLRQCRREARETATCTRTAWRRWPWRSFPRLSPPSRASHSGMPAAPCSAAGPWPGRAILPVSRYCVRDWQPGKTRAA